MVHTLRSAQTELEISFLKLAIAVTRAVTPYRSLAPLALLAWLLGLVAGFIRAVIQ